MEYSFRVDEINSAADLQNYFPHPHIISCKRIASLVDVSPQISSGAIIQNEEHLFAVRNEEAFVEGNDVWVGRDELVVIYFARGIVKSVIDVVRGWDARRIWVGDVDDFHSTTNISIDKVRQPKIDNLVHGTESS